MPARRLLAAVAAASLLAPTAANAAFGDVLWVSEPPDDHASPGFGVSVAAQDGIALVSAIPWPRDGAAVTYVIDVATGAVQHTLTDPDPVSTGWFGDDLAIDGGIAVVADQADAAAYVYNAMSGDLLHTLRPDRLGEYWAFGNAVDIDVESGLIAVGDYFYGDESVGRNAGAVHLYDLATGDHLRRITGEEGKSFGASVALGGGLLSVGSPVYGDGETSEEVSVYEPHSGTLVRRVPSPSSLGASDFGHSGVIDGRHQVVTGRGVGFVFDLPSGDLLTQLHSNPIETLSYHIPWPKGDAIAAEDGVVFVASDSTALVYNQSFRTAVYAFDAVTGRLLSVIRPDAERPWGHTTEWIAVDNGTLLVGMVDYPGFLGDEDSVHAFDVSLDMAGDFNGDGVVDAADYTLWRDGLPRLGPILPIDPSVDPNNDGIVDRLDYNIWVHTFGDANAAPGTVPEPAAAVLLTLGLLAVARRC